MATVRGDHITTRIPSWSYTLKWSVDKFAKLLPEKKIRSPIFRPVSDTEWYSELEKSSSGVQWTFYDSSKTNIHVHHDISIINSEGNILFQKSIQKEYSPNNYSCIVIDYSDKTSLNDVHVATFVCHMTLTGNEIESEIAELKPGVRDSAHNLKKLSDDLKTMYGVSLYTDVCLRVDGDNIRAHRAVLCARSPVFAKMFEHGLNEKETGEINITDLESSVLKHLVSFLYTGILLDESFDSVLALYYAADKYDVADLRQRCSDILLDEITVDNACQVLAFANQHSDDTFKKSAMSVLETHLEPILGKDGWKELLKNEPSLASEVMECYIEKRSQQKNAQMATQNQIVEISPAIQQAYPFRLVYEKPRRLRTYYR